jgi:long-chain acyl-CoA synthetase
MALAAANTAGCEIELHSQYSPALTRSALVERAITLWPAVPLMFDTVSQSEKMLGPHRLRLAISAGSPLPQRVYQQFLKAFNIPIGQLYGASEFGSATYNSPSLTPFYPAAAGRPFSGVEVRVLEIGQPCSDTPLAAGCSGEIAIRTPSMLSEYLDSAEVIDPSGFIRTGDIGTVDEGGVIHLTGRVKLLIDIGAQKANPLEIESIFIQHPSVAEAVVVAVPFSDTANRLKAVVLSREGYRADPDELRAYLREHLISYKIPRIIEVREELPRSPTGKILREVVQADAIGGRR